MSKFLSYLEHIPSSEIVKSYNYPFKSFKKTIIYGRVISDRVTERGEAERLRSSTGWITTQTFAAARAGPG